MCNFEANFQKHIDVTILNIYYSICKVYEYVFQNNNIIVNQHVNFEIFYQMNFSFDKNFDKSVISRVREINK